MRELTFVGLSNDGSRVVLSGGDGETYSVPVDQRLATAVRQDRSRLGQLEIEMDGGLRPKDIQARIRAGMSAEEVAAAAGLPLDKVQRFEGAVLAERAYVAEKASATTVRSPSGSGVLSELVATRLASRGVDPETMRWDSWRRDDGRWVLFLGYGEGGGDEQSATWYYDVVARAVVPADDDARWLVEEKPPASPESAPGPRLVPVPAAIEDDVFFDQEAAGEPEASVTPIGVARSETTVVVERAEQDEAPEEVADEPEPEPAPAPRPRPTAQTGSRSKRAAVPSWDEILFGSKKTD